MDDDMHFLLYAMTKYGVITPAQRRQIHKAFEVRDAKRDQQIRDIEEDVFGEDMRWGDS